MTGQGSSAKAAGNSERGRNDSRLAPSEAIFRMTRGQPRMSLRSSGLRLLRDDERTAARSRMTQVSNWSNVSRNRTAL
jgi:hypothetical protein